jgi:hypothetical protein
MAMAMKNAVLWDVAPCRYCINRRFGGMYRLHLQVKEKRKIHERGISVSRWLQTRRHIPLDGIILGILTDVQLFKAYFQLHRLYNFECLDDYKYEFERMSKEMVMPYFKVLPNIPLQVMRKRAEGFSENIRSRVRDSNPGPK